MIIIITRGSSELGEAHNLSRPGATPGPAPNPHDSGSTRCLPGSRRSPPPEPESSVGVSPVAMDGPGDTPVDDLVADRVKLLAWFNRVPSVSRELLEGMNLNCSLQVLCRLGMLRPCGSDISGRWGERYVRGDCLTDE